MNDKERLEFVIKSVTRTDSYLNYANTKSTILLTLSSATLGTAAVNLTKLLPTEVEKLATIQSMFFYLFSIIFFVLIALSIYESIQAINPYLRKSDQENIFSFVDITEYNNSHNEYFNKIASKDEAIMFKELSSLNYNLAKGLLLKYKRQKKSIYYFLGAIVSASFSVGIPNIIAIKNQSESGIATLIFFITLSFVIAIVFKAISFFTNKISLRP